MLESFSSLPSIFEYLVLGKDTKNTAEHVIMKKSLFTHARAQIKLSQISLAWRLMKLGITILKYR